MKKTIMKKASKINKNNDITISFNIDNVMDATQTIRLNSEIALTPQEFIKGLNAGNIITSISTDGEVFLIGNTFKRIGTVITTEFNHDLAYIDFKLA